VSELEADVSELRRLLHTAAEGPVSASQRREDLEGLSHRALLKRAKILQAGALTEEKRNHVSSPDKLKELR
jgi:hypothetical protein